MIQKLITINDLEIKYEYSLVNIIGFVYNNTRYTYQKNILKDVLKIFKEDSTLVAEYSYDSFVNTTVINYTDDNIGDINPIRYRSYYYDNETNLYFLQNRYYSPSLRRFISPDSFDYLDPQSINGLTSIFIVETILLI